MGCCRFQNQISLKESRAYNGGGVTLQVKKCRHTHIIIVMFLISCVLFTQVVPLQQKNKILTNKNKQLWDS